jgi:competence protein ComEC
VTAQSNAALRNEARKRRPHLTIACVIAGLALAPLGPAAILVAATIAAALAGAAFCPLVEAAAGSGGAFGASTARPLVVAFGSRTAICAAALVVGAGIGGAWRLGSIDAPARAAPEGSVVDTTATLLERPRAGTFGSSAPMRIETGPAAGLRFMARRRQRDWPAMDPGIRFRIRGFVRIQAPAPAQRGLRFHADAALPSEANAGVPGTPGFGPLPARPGPGDDFDYGAFLRSRGIGREVEIEELRPLGRRGGLTGLVDSIRRNAERGISANLSSDHAALARGMVLGEDGDVSDVTRDDFQRSGLAHMLAASGQNVALLCALALPLLILIGASIAVRVAVLLPLVGLYVALAGSGASVTRAGLMAAAALIALGAGRRASAVYALQLAAVVTLAINPRATGDAGWQLSFAAVLGMLALTPLVQPRLERLPRPLAGALAATLAATLATAPLMAHLFGAVSLAALPANLLAFPAVAPVMWLGMTAATLQQIASLVPPFAGITHAIEGLTGPVSELALRWLAGVAGYLADPSWAQSSVHLGWPTTAVAYVLIAAVVAVFANRRRSSRAQTVSAAIHERLGPLLDWLRALSPASRRAFAAPVLALMLGVAAYGAAAPAAPKHLTVDFLDVGQGDATLIRDTTGAAVLFDGGVPEARVDRTLRRLGVRRLSVVVATHQSRDHHGGLLQVVRRFPVGLFLDGGDGTTDPTFLQLEREVDRRRIARRPTRAGEHLRVGQMTIHILSPPARPPGPAPADPNPRATVAIVSSGDFDLLLSADAESPTLLSLPLHAVDAMKQPHHGSADPGLPQVLARLRPKVVAIETGRGNRYGHPRPPTLDALRGRVPRVYRTDRDGMIELTVNGGRIAIRTHR